MYRESVKVRRRDGKKAAKISEIPERLLEKCASAVENIGHRLRIIDLTMRSLAPRDTLDAVIPVANASSFRTGIK